MNASYIYTCIQFHHQFKVFACLSSLYIWSESVWWVCYWIAVCPFLLISLKSCARRHRCENRFETIFNVFASRAPAAHLCMCMFVFFEGKGHKRFVPDERTKWLKRSSKCQWICNRRDWKVKNTAMQAAVAKRAKTNGERWEKWVRETEGESWKHLCNIIFNQIMKTFYLLLFYFNFFPLFQYCFLLETMPSFISAACSAEIVKNVIAHTFIVHVDFFCLLSPVRFDANHARHAWRFLDTHTHSRAHMRINIISD